MFYSTSTRIGTESFFAAFRTIDEAYEFRELLKISFQTEVYVDRNEGTYDYQNNDSIYSLIEYISEIITDQQHVSGRMCHFLN